MGCNAVGFVSCLVSCSVGVAVCRWYGCLVGAGEHRLSVLRPGQGALTPASRPAPLRIGPGGAGLDRPDRAREADHSGRSREQAPGWAAGMRQGRLWNARGGLAALANDSTGELTLGSCPFPQPCSATLPAAKLEPSCFVFGSDLVQPVCGGQPEQSSCLGVWPCGLGAALCSPRVVQAQYLRGLTPE